MGEIERNQTAKSGNLTLLEITLIRRADQEMSFTKLLQALVSLPLGSGNSIALRGIGLAELCIIVITVHYAAQTVLRFLYVGITSRALGFTTFMRMWYDVYRLN